MKKIFVFVMAVCLVSCSKQAETACEIEEDKQEEVTRVEFSEDYETMYLFVQNIVDSELFGIDMPVNPTLDDLMKIGASAILHELWGDTLGEADYRKEYEIILAYYLKHAPDAEIVELLEMFFEHGMY